MRGKYELTFEEKAKSYYHSEIKVCKNCGHPIEELYHNIYRHITDTDTGLIAGKECHICGCKSPEPKEGEE